MAIENPLALVDDELPVLKASKRLKRSEPIRTLFDMSFNGTPEDVEDLVEQAIAQHKSQRRVYTEKSGWITKQDQIKARGRQVHTFLAIKKIERLRTASESTRRTEQGVLALADNIQRHMELGDVPEVYKGAYFEKAVQHAIAQCTPMPPHTKVRSSFSVSKAETTVPLKARSGKPFVNRQLEKIDRALDMLADSDVRRVTRNVKSTIEILRGYLDPQILHELDQRLKSKASAKQLTFSRKRGRPTTTESFEKPLRLISSASKELKADDIKNVIVRLEGVVDKLHFRDKGTTREKESTYAEMPRYPAVHNGAEANDSRQNSGVTPQP